jgi:predicted secreted hydrolase
VTARRSPAGRLPVTVVLVALVASACGGAPILANPPLSFPSPAIASPGPTHPGDPIPISLPRDDGPHDRLTEWWYYTGHLQTETGRRFGFEAVVFRAERGAVPAAWASHVALTDEGTPGVDSGGTGTSFHYAQRSEVGAQVDRSPRDAAGRPTGFDLQVGGLSPTLIAAGATAMAAPWRLAGSNGSDRIVVALSPEEAAAAGAAFGFELDLEPIKPPALHDGDGFVDFGPAGTSYYYSRTRLAARGVVELDGERLAVDGIAWFDHQWGDFVSVGGGGWDWFAINLDDGRDITLSVVRDEFAREVFAYGTLIEADGSTEPLLGFSDVATPIGTRRFGISPGRPWESPLTGRTYTISWSVFLEPATQIDLKPTVENQELDTRATTGVIYWEGSHEVTVLVQPEDGSEPVPVDGGDAYVEITRYGLPGG